MAPPSARIEPSLPPHELRHRGRLDDQATLIELEVLEDQDVLLRGGNFWDRVDFAADDERSGQAPRHLAGHGAVKMGMNPEQPGRMTTRQRESVGDRFARIHVKKDVVCVSSRWNVQTMEMEVYWLRERVVESDRDLVAGTRLEQRARDLSVEREQACRTSAEKHVGFGSSQISIEMRVITPKY